MASRFSQPASTAGPLPPAPSVHQSGLIPSSQHCCSAPARTRRRLRPASSRGSQLATRRRGTGENGRRFRRCPLPAASKGGAPTRCPRGHLRPRQTGAGGKAHPPAARPPSGALLGQAAVRERPRRPGHSPYPPATIKAPSRDPSSSLLLLPREPPRVGRWRLRPPPRCEAGGGRGGPLSPSSSAVPPSHRKMGEVGQGVRPERPPAPGGRGPRAAPRTHLSPAAAAALGPGLDGEKAGGHGRWGVSPLAPGPLAPTGLSATPGPLATPPPPPGPRRRRMPGGGERRAGRGPGGGAGGGSTAGRGARREEAAAAAPGPETSPSRDSTTRSHERPASGSRRKSLLRRRKGLAGGAARSGALSQHPRPRIGGGAAARGVTRAEKHVTRLTSPALNERAEAGDAVCRPRAFVSSHLP